LGLPALHREADPDTKEPLKDPQLYAALQMNPVHNAENLSPEYLEELDNLPARMRLRFRDGECTRTAATARSGRSS
jgi:hypothetical protein